MDRGSGQCGRSLVLEYGVFQPDPEPPAPVASRVPWEAEGTSANVAGAQSNGTVQRLENGSVLVNGTVTDTKADHHGVKLKVVAIDARGNAQSIEAVNRRMQWSHVGLGPGGAETDHPFPGDIKKISINECVLGRDDDQRSYEKECGNSAVIWPKRR